MKRCEYCGKDIPKEPNWPPERHAKRRFCSKDCYFKLMREKGQRNEKERTKPCEYCGKEFTRSTFVNGLKESWPHWQERRFCSRECGMKASGKTNDEPAPKKKVDPRVEYDDAWLVVRYLVNNEKIRKGKVNIMGKVEARMKEQLRRVDEAEVREKYETLAKMA